MLILPYLAIALVYLPLLYFPEGARNCASVAPDRCWDGLLTLRAADLSRKGFQKAVILGAAVYSTLVCCTHTAFQLDTLSRGFEDADCVEPDDGPSAAVCLFGFRRWQSGNAFIRSALPHLIVMLGSVPVYLRSFLRQRGVAKRRERALRQMLHALEPPFAKDSTGEVVPDSMEVAHLKQELSLIVRSRGDIVQAHKLLSHAVQMQQRLLGSKDDIFLANGMAQLAALLRQLGDAAHQEESRFLMSAAEDMANRIGRPLDAVSRSSRRASCCAGCAEVYYMFSGKFHLVGLKTRALHKVHKHTKTAALRDGAYSAMIFMAACTDPSLLSLPLFALFVGLTAMYVVDVYRHDLPSEVAKRARREDETDADFTRRRQERRARRKQRYKRWRPFVRLYTGIYLLAVFTYQIESVPGLPDGMHIGLLRPLNLYASSLAHAASLVLVNVIATINIIADGDDELARFHERYTEAPGLRAPQLQTRSERAMTTPRQRSGALQLNTMRAAAKWTAKTWEKRKGGGSPSLSASPTTTEGEPGLPETNADHKASESGVSGEISGVGQAEATSERGSAEQRDLGPDAEKHSDIGFIARSGDISASSSTAHADDVDNDAALADSGAHRRSVSSTTATVIGRDVEARAGVISSQPASEVPARPASKSAPLSPVSQARRRKRRGGLNTAASMQSTGHSRPESRLSESGAFFQGIAKLRRQRMLTVLLSKHGMLLYTLVYIAMSIETPSILSFLFLIVVFAGLAFPRAVFGIRSATDQTESASTGLILPIIAFTWLFGVTRYVYTVVMSVGQFDPDATTEVVGLVKLRPGEFAWLSIYTPLICVVLAAGVVKSRKIVTDDVDYFSGIPLLQQLANMLRAYVYHNDGAVHITIFLCFYTGIDAIDYFHLPFIGVFIVVVLIPRARHAWLWRSVILYCEFVILSSYWWYFPFMESVAADSVMFFGDFIVEDGWHTDPSLMRWRLARPIALLLFAVLELSVARDKEEKTAAAQGGAAGMRPFADENLLLGAGAVRGEDSLTAKAFLKLLSLVKGEQRTWQTWGPILRPSAAWVGLVGTLGFAVAIALGEEHVSVLSIVYISVVCTIGILRVVVQQWAVRAPGLVRVVMTLLAVIVAASLIFQYLLELEESVVAANEILLLDQHSIVSSGIMVVLAMLLSQLFQPYNEGNPSWVVLPKQIRMVIVETYLPIRCWPSLWTAVCVAIADSSAIGFVYVLTAVVSLPLPRGPPSHAELCLRRDDSGRAGHRHGYCGIFHQRNAVRILLTLSSLATLVLTYLRHPSLSPLVENSKGWALAGVLPRPDVEETAASFTSGVAGHLILSVVCAVEICATGFRLRTEHRLPKEKLASPTSLRALEARPAHSDVASDGMQSSSEAVPQNAQLSLINRFLNILTNIVAWASDTAIAAVRACANVVVSTSMVLRATRGSWSAEAALALMMLLGVWRGAFVACLYVAVVILAVCLPYKTVMRSWTVLIALDAVVVLASFALRMRFVFADLYGPQWDFVLASTLPVDWQNWLTAPRTTNPWRTLADIAVYHLLCQHHEKARDNAAHVDVQFVGTGDLAAALRKHIVAPAGSGRDVMQEWGTTKPARLLAFDMTDSAKAARRAFQDPTSLHASKVPPNFFDFVFAKYRTSTIDHIRFFLFHIYPYAVMAFIFVSGTLCPCVLSAPYVILPMYSLGADIRGVLAWKTWVFSVLWLVNLFVIAARVAFQVPSIQSSAGRASWQVLLGVRKVSVVDGSVSWEILLDGIICMLLFSVRLLFMRAEIGVVLGMHDKHGDYARMYGRGKREAVEAVRMERLEKIETTKREMNQQLKELASMRVGGVRPERDVFPSRRQTVSSTADSVDSTRARSGTTFEAGLDVLERIEERSRTEMAAAEKAAEDARARAASRDTAASPDLVDLDSADVSPASRHRIRSLPLARSGDGSSAAASRPRSRTEMPASSVEGSPHPVTSTSARRERGRTSSSFGGSVSQLSRVSSHSARSGVAGAVNRARGWAVGNVEDVNVNAKEKLDQFKGAMGSILKTGVAKLRRGSIAVPFSRRRGTSGGWEPTHETVDEEDAEVVDDSDDLSVAAEAPRADVAYEEHIPRSVDSSSIAPVETWLEFSLILRMIRGSHQILLRRSILIVYFSMVLNYLLQPNAASAVLPLGVFGFALICNPRQLPRVSGGLIHPLVQNPPRSFWRFMALYVHATIVLKFIFQMPRFCVCGDSYSSFPECNGFDCECRVSPLQRVELECELTADEDTFDPNPVLIDEALGIKKLWGNTVPDVADELAGEEAAAFPFAGVPLEGSPLSGTSAEPLLEGAVEGKFLLSVIPDLCVVGAILLHIFLMRRQGVWKGRLPRNSHGVGALDETLPFRGRASSLEIQEDALTLAEVALQATVHATVDRNRSCCLRSRMKCASRISRLVAFVSDACTRLAKWIVHETREVRLELHVAFMPHAAAETLDWKSREKPGSDLYSATFFVQLAEFLVIAFTYRGQGGTNLVEGIQRRSLESEYVGVLGAWFMVMVIDRMLYLVRSHWGKVVLHYANVLLPFWTVHVTAGGADLSDVDVGLLVWLVVHFVYLLLSALQLSYGYPKLQTQQFLTRNDHWFMGYVFLVYRSIPFLYELRMLLDWTCTKTTLFLREWMILEDISTHLFLTMTDIHFRREDANPRGLVQPAWRKILVGFLLFAALCIIVWFPLVLFSSAVSVLDFPVTTVSLTLGLPGFPALYEINHPALLTEQSVSALEPSGAESATQYCFQRPYRPSLQCMHYDLGLDAADNAALAGTVQESNLATYRDEFRDEIQKVELFADSGRMWGISPPSRAALERMLRRPPDRVPTSLQMTLKFTRQTLEGSVFGATAQSERHFRTPDLAASFRDELAGLLNGTKQSVALPHMVPRILRIYSTDEIEPLPRSFGLGTDQSWTNCTLTSNYTGNSEDGREWWSFSCDSSRMQISGESGPSFYVIAAKASFSAFFVGGGTVLGLYLTFLISVSRFLRLWVTGIKRDIMYDGLTETKALHKLVMDIYHARMFGMLDVEETLYETLLDTYRQPQVLFNKTKPFKHWFADQFIANVVRRLKLPLKSMEELLDARHGQVSERRYRKVFGDAHNEILAIQSRYGLTEDGEDVPEGERRSLRQKVEELYGATPEAEDVVQFLRRAAVVMRHADGAHHEWPVGSHRDRGQVGPGGGGGGGGAADDADDDDDDGDDLGGGGSGSGARHAPGGGDSELAKAASAALSSAGGGPKSGDGGLEESGGKVRQRRPGKSGPKTTDADTLHSRPSVKELRAIFDSPSKHDD